MTESPNIDLNSLSTFDIAFNLATGQYDEKTKFIALSIIREREAGKILPLVNQPVIRKAKTKPPLKGSKAEKIWKLLNSGKTATETYQILKNKNEVISPSEVYRVGKDYWPELFIKQ